MSDRIKKIKIKRQDGTFSDYIPIGADADSLYLTDGESVEYKLNKKPYYYNSVANMKADTKLKIRDMVITLGYYEANDGGKAKYYITENIDNIITNDGFHILLDNGLVANLLIENSVVNIKSLGAKSYDGQNKTDIATYINYYMNNVKSSIVTLFIPAGLWHCSGFTFNHSFSLKGVKDCTTNSTVRGTYITSLNDNQDYIFKIWGLSSFNLEDISFTTCEGSRPFWPGSDSDSDSDLIYYMQILLNRDTKRINNACLKFISVNSGVVKNINFYGIIGKAMTMCSSEEITFDNINFQSISNIDNYIVSFETKIEHSLSITDCVFKYIYFKGIHGALFEVQQDAWLMGNDFYCISFEDNILANIANIRDEDYAYNYDDFNDNTAIHQPLFDLKGNCGSNTIHSLNLYIADHYLNYNNNKYVHDTIFKFSNSNFKASFIVNAINASGLGKDIKIILSKNNTLKNCQMYFGKISHKYYYSSVNKNFYFDVENFPYIESENTLNGYDYTAGIGCDNVTSFIDCLVTGGFSTSSRGLICFDNEARSKSRLCIKPEIISENSGDRIFAMFLQKSKKLYIRAKIENGVTAISTLLLEDNSGYQNLDMVGTGQFKTYEFDVAFDIGSILKIVTSSSSTNTGLYDCFWFG